MEHASGLHCKYPGGTDESNADPYSVIVISTWAVIRIAPYVPLLRPPIEQDSTPAQVVPIPCHSHNDYWRQQPLFSALEAGCTSVEADVWPYLDDLYVGHNPGSLQPGFTLQNAYLDPLRLLLQDKNCAAGDSGCSLDGVYKADPSQTIVLLVDVKDDPYKAWPLLVKQLESLRQQGWLTTFQDGKLKTAPITVVVSGAVLHASSILETAHSPDLGIFFDAPLLGLEEGRYDASNSYWASSSLKKSVGLDWSGGLGTEQLEQVRSQVNLAHSLGLKARYWGLPSWPVGSRNEVWQVLLDAGLDVTNVDDLKGFARFWERREDGNMSSR